MNEELVKEKRMDKLFKLFLLLMIIGLFLIALAVVLFVICKMEIAKYPTAENIPERAAALIAKFWRIGTIISIVGGVLDCISIPLMIFALVKRNKIRKKSVLVKESKEITPVETKEKVVVTKKEPTPIASKKVIVKKRVTKKSTPSKKVAIKKPLTKKKTTKKPVKTKPTRKKKK